MLKKIFGCQPPQTLQCGNYGIGGHYWTHPDYHNPSPAHWMNPNSVGNRVATILTLLDAPSAGSEHFAWNHETFELGLS
jgi:hypothetical protein